MTIVGWVYLIIKLIELFVLYRVGVYIETKSSKNKYWKYASFAIITFGLVEGLRWGHMRDYNIYYYNYTAINTFQDVCEESSPVFAFLVYILRNLGIDYPSFLILQSAFLMFSCLFFLKDYSKNARITLPCLLIALAMNENFIRTYLGMSFFLIGFTFFNNKKYKIALGFIVVSILTHFACGFMILFVMMKPILEKGGIKPIYSVPLIIFTTFFVSITQMSILVSMSNYVTKLLGGNVDTLALDYIDSMDRIIVGEGGAGLGISETTILSQIKYLLSCLPVVLICYKDRGNIPSGVYLYNLVLIGFVFCPIFSQVELLGRFTDQLLIFVPLFMSHMVRISKEKKKAHFQQFVAICSLLVYMYGSINRPFVMPDKEMYFIWDSNGMPTNSNY